MGDSSKRKMMEVLYLEQNDDKHEIEMLRLGSKHKDAIPCIVCGRFIDVTKPHKMVWLSYDLKLLKEGDQVSDGADLGYHPIGPECLKKHPEYKPFVFSVK